MWYYCLYRGIDMSEEKAKAKKNMVHVTPKVYEDLTSVQSYLEDEMLVKYSYRQVIEYLINYWDRNTNK
tara:strand:- start:598 stop:804 length:207 start_codon:yes stop_codon:yes gene_type:complete